MTDVSRPYNLLIQQSVSVRSVSDLGDLIRRSRREQGLTQQQLADLAGVGRRYLLELEAGKDRAELGRALLVCAALGIDLTARTR